MTSEHKPQNDLFDNHLGLYKTSRFLFSSVKFFIILSIIITILSIFGNFIFDFLKEIKPGQIETEFAKYTDISSWIFKPSTYAFHFGNLRMLLSKFKINEIIYITSQLSILSYLVSIVLRHHFREQQPLLDDFKAYYFKKDIIESLELPSGLERFSEKKDGKKISRQEEEFYENLRLLTVNIRTIAQRVDDKVYQYYVVEWRQPKKVKQQELVSSKLKNFGFVLTNKSKGEVTFGDLQLDMKNDKYIFKGNREVESLTAKRQKVNIKSANNDEVEESIKDGDNEWSFPLSIFNDNTAKIDKRRKQAEEFAEEHKKDIISYFNSDKFGAGLESTFVGNSSIQYKFNIPFSTKMPQNIETLSKKISDVTGVAGIQVNLRAGKLTITIPLPEGKEIPIDVKQMIVKTYKEERSGHAKLTK